MMQAKPSQEEKPPSKKRSRVWIFLLIGASLLSGIAYVLWLFLQKPAIGEIRVGKQAPAEERNTGKKQRQFTGKYLIFSYPAAYVEKSHEIPVSGPVKESIFLSAADIEGRKMAITVEERERGDFEASPSFQMRSDESGEYDQESVAVGGFSGFLFKKDSQVFERTFFLHSEDFVISISATSPFGAEDLEQGLFALIGSLRFRE
ncbi:MAG: hypothetical protein WAW00_03465 [Candidatus Moraniibacteriota bacterium]